MEIQLLDTIRDIDRDQWRALVGEDLPERAHGWYRAVEESKMRDLHYVAVYHRGTLTAAACTHVQQEQHSMIKMPFLEVFSPLGSERAFFFNSTEEIPFLLKGLEELRVREDAQGILALDFEEKCFNQAKDYMKKFVPFPLKDRAYIDLDFADFADYLSALDSSSRRSIRKTLNRNEKRWHLTHVVSSDFSRWKKVAHALQEHTCAEHNDFRMHLTEAFYTALEKHFSETAELTIFLKDDIPIASGLCLNSPTVAVHKFAGVDPRYRKYQAYFLLYYEGIKTALERNQKKIYFGVTTYEFKQKIGCKMEPLAGFARLSNPVLNLALRPYLTFFNPRRAIEGEL